MLPLKKFQFGLTDDGPFSSSQRRSLSASSFYTSLLQATDGAMPLALCPQVCFKLFNTASDVPRRKPPVMVALPARYLLPGNNDTHFRNNGPDVCRQ